jgi:hypothetical protein
MRCVNCLTSIRTSLPPSPHPAAGPSGVPTRAGRHMRPCERLRRDPAPTCPFGYGPPVVVDRCDTPAPLGPQRASGSTHPGVWGCSVMPQTRRRNRDVPVCQWANSAARQPIPMPAALKCTHRRFTRPFLAPKRGPGWDVMAQVRGSVANDELSALRHIATLAGHARVPQKHVEDAVRLGKWVAVQRQKRGSLRAERRARLETVPGWWWGGT